MGEITQSANDALGRLRVAIVALGVTQSSLSDATGVDQSQISRILSGKSKRVSKNAQKLIEYTEKMHICIGDDEQLPPVLVKAVRLAWDRTAEHAEALARVIASMRGLVVR